MYKKPINNIYKILFIAVCTGCILLSMAVFISTYIFNQTRSLMYLEYLTEKYTEFNEKCENFITGREFVESCKKCVLDKKNLAEIKYKLKDIGYESEAKVIITDKKGDILFAEHEDLHIRSFLKIVTKNAKNSKIYHSIYKIRTYTSDLVYTYTDSDFVINLFIERPVWERVFPKYRYDGVITGKNVIMMSREVFVSELNKFDPDKNKKELNDYVINAKNLDDGTKIYSMVYSPNSMILLLVGIVMIIIFGGIWSIIVIKTSIKTVKKEAMAKEELIKRNYIAEIRELTARINPHFMYNTLEMIKFLAITEPKVARKIIEKFTKILRYSISDTEMEITLEEDLSYIEDYITIQKERFQERFKCDFIISEEAKRARVMKLVLQPIIENSIKYGFKKNPTLSITIEGRVEKDYLILTVKDDGGGMEEEALRELRERIKNGEVTGSHNGIHNIARRLELKYKGKSGVTVENFESGFKVALYIKQTSEE